MALTPLTRHFPLRCSREIPPQTVILEARQQLYGNGGDDLLQGGEGEDTLDGGADQDRLEGGRARDILIGGMGADRVDGGTGSDRMEGGEGNDIYLLRNGDGQDRILDDHAWWSNGAAAGVDEIDFVGMTDSVVVAVERVGNDLVIRYGSGRSSGNGDSDQFSGFRRTDFKRDLLGRVVQEMRPERLDSEGEVNSRPSVNIEVDRWGNVTSQSRPGSPNVMTKYTYDANDNVIEEVLPDVTVR